jgi:hypothetical protein
MDHVLKSVVEMLEEYDIGTFYVFRGVDGLLTVFVPSETCDGVFRLNLDEPAALDRLWVWAEGVQRGVQEDRESGGGPKDA